MSNLSFMKLKRKNNISLAPVNRIENYLDFHIQLEENERKKQADRCMNCGVPFCQFGGSINNKTIGCPLNNYIPEWNGLLALGKYEAAYGRLTLTSPFPEFTSRVCPALCEVGCVCNINDEPITVRENEYFIIENAFKEGLVQPRTINHKYKEKIAVIGSGPAGLSVGNELNTLGYDVTIFEKNDNFGGLLMYGIPNMKLEKSIIERRIKILKEEGIKFISNYDANDHYDELMKEFDVVVFSTGASQPRILNVIGSTSEKVLYAVDFLTETTKTILSGKDSLIARDKRVIVVGGGDTGNDCVATCMRQKAKSIIQYEQNRRPANLRTNHWPEWPDNLKVEYGAEEHISIYGNDQRVFGRTIKEINEKENCLVVTTIEVKKVNQKIVEIENTEEVIEADLIILAMGFSGTKEEIFDSFHLEKDGRNNIKTIDFQTSNPKVFSCGDSRTGQSLVVKAISDGIGAAKAVHNHLQK